MDWQNGSEYLHGKDVPDSCCLSHEKDCGKEILVDNNILNDDNTTLIYTKGCISKLYSDMKDSAAMVMGIGGVLGIGGAIGIIQLLTCIFAFILGCQFGKQFILI